MRVLLSIVVIYLIVAVGVLIAKQFLALIGSALLFLALFVALAAANR